MSNDAKTVVLIADDEPSTLALLGRHLRSRGYAVLEASDGDEAWELAHEHLPDLVILDVMMPGMSGWEVCRKVREAVSLAHTGVIMLTGIGETLNEMTSPLYGADAHVDKPFEFSTLDARIGEVLERRRAGALGRPDDADEVRVALADVAKPIAKAKPQAVAKPKPAAAPKPTAKAPAKPKEKPKTAKKAPPPPKKAAKKAAKATKAPAPKKAAKKTKSSGGSPKNKPKAAKKPSKVKLPPPKTSAKTKASAKTKPAKAPAKAKAKSKPKAAKKRR